jgi:nucleotide-binding universal stress UspA family protein
VLAWHHPTAASVPPVGVTPPTVEREVEEHTTAMLEDAITKAAPGWPALQIDSEIRYGHPAQVLIDESRRADLLVVGRRGHGGFISVLIGSISQHRVAAAECPVIVVRTNQD